MRLILLNTQLILLSVLICSEMPGQRVPVMADSSVLAGIPLPCKALMEKRLFFSAAAKTVLEMEASKYQIIISDVEVFSFPNTTTAQENRQLLADTLFNSLKNSGYEIRSSNDDPAYTWLSTNNRKIIMYFMVNKKETSLYFGKADKLPPSFSTTSAIAEKSTMKSEGTKTWVNSDLSSNISSDNSNPPGLANLSAEGRQLTGKWGNLSGSKVNYQDESTGYMVVSGQSRGYGLELRPDGSFLQTTVVTSGRPSYRIFVSTTGNWTTNNNQLIFYPKDRHYRKWENEMITTDEHSVPERYTMFWNKKINDITGKECLYVKYDIGQPQWDELCKE